MYKKLLAIVLAMAMVMLSSAIVMAEENDNAAGEESAEANAKIDITSILDEISSEIGDDAEIKEALEELVGTLLDESGSLDSDKIDTIKDIDLVMDSLFAGKDESEEPGDAKEALGISFEELETAICTYLLDETAEYLETGDETLFYHVIADIDAHEDETIHLLGYFMIMNYDVDEECPDDLIVKNGECLTELLTLTKNDDGVYEVTEHITAEEGEGYADSVALMCEAMDMDPDDFYEDLAIFDLVYISDLYDFLEVHPEYDHVEYNGEMMTLDELNSVFTKEVNDYLALYNIDATLNEE